MARYKKSESKQNKEEAQRRLLEAAIDEFATYGYAGANINRISQAAGFAQGTVYNYFPSKRALFVAVIQEIAERHCALILQGAASAASPAVRLERFFVTGLAFAQGFPNAAQVVVSALYGADSEIRALVQQAYRPLWQYVEEEIVLTGLQEESFRPMEPEMATATIMAVYLSGCLPGPDGDAIGRNPRAVAAVLLEGMVKRKT